MITDDAVREEHGIVANNGQRGSVYERDDHIVVDLHGYSTMHITPEKAAYLGSKLRRLARRVIARRDAEA